MSARLAVLISGSGTNLQAIIDAVRMRVLPAEIVVVVSNRKDAFGLQRAAKAGIPTLYHPLKPYTDDGRSRQEYDAELAAQLRTYKPDWIVLAGWGTGGKSSSAIVTVAVEIGPTPAPPVAPVRVTVKFSGPSTCVSARIATLKSLGVSSPSFHVSVPEAAA